jgi:hypothetical protein
MDDDKVMLAIDAAYQHGFAPKLVSYEDDIVSILGRAPTQEEAKLCAEARKEGFRARIKGG